MAAQYEENKNNSFVLRARGAVLKNRPLVLNSNEA